MATIMVVDDEEQIGRLLLCVFSTMGHRGICMPSGQAAVAYLKTRQPDLVFLDMMLPDLDGTEVLRFIRQNLRQNLPVIVYTAISDPAFREHVLKLGANEYWVKASVDVDQIKSGVERLAHVAAAA